MSSCQFLYNEATLHTLVEQAPQLFPLAGTPRLIIVGREVQLGSGRADLIAIEPSGRLAIIEIKLARNEEARRAIITQVLAYAAYLWWPVYLQFWRSVFERRAPLSLAHVESITHIKQGNSTREVSDELLDALTTAYKEAAGGAIEG